MQSLFDLRVLSAISLASNLMLVAAMLLSRRVDRGSPSIGSWISGSVQVAAGFLLIGLRGVLPDLLSIVMANVLIASGFCWFYFAMRLTLGLPRGPRWDLACGLIAAAGVIHFTYVAPSLAARIVIMSAVVATLGFAGARLLLFSGEARRDPDGPALKAIGLAVLVLAVVYALRAVLCLLDPPAGDFLALTGAIHRVAFLANLLLSLTLILGLAHLFSMRAQRRLRASEARFEATFDQAAVGVGIFNLDGRFLRANRRLCEILGYSEAELKELRFHDLTHPDDLATSEADRARMVAGSSASVTRDKRYLRKDGSPVWVRRSTTLVRNAEGSPDHFVSAIDDIQATRDAEEKLHAARFAAFEDADRSRRAALNLMEDALAARRRAEETATHLKGSEERLRLLIEHAPAALAMFDRNMHYLAASHRWRDDYRLGERDLVGLSHYTLFPEVGEDLKAIHRRGMAGEVVASQEDRFERADGRVHWLRWEMRPWRHGSGEVGGIVIFSEDISARRAAEDALRESEERYRSVVDSIKEVIFRTDAQGVWTFLNPAWTEITGFAVETSLGSPFLDYVHPDDRQRNLELFGPLIRREKDHCRHTIRYLRRQGGYRWIEVYARLTLDAGGGIVGTTGTLADITERKSAEDELQARNEELERFNRATVGRELDMIALKGQINALATELGREPPYPLTFLRDEDRKVTS